MGNWILGIGLALIVGSVFYLGIRHISDIMASTKKVVVQLNKQDYVKQNRQQYGASNRGTSMDKRNVYAKTPSDLGL